MKKSTVITAQCGRCHKFGGHRISHKNGNILVHCFACKFDEIFDGYTARKIIPTLAQ